jgi:23S rRNA (uracil1939-C5)-methyltransferase
MGRRSRNSKRRLTESTLTVTAEMGPLASGGACVGTITSASAVLEDFESASFIGKKVFVPFTAPGELVTARITDDHKSYCEGTLVSIERRSEHRVDPKCPHFGLCGGCDLQHVTLPYQREMKRLMVEGDLIKQGKISPRNGVTLLTTELPGFGYRRRMSFHLNNRGDFGLYRKSGRQIEPLSHCPIATEPINRCLSENLSDIIACGPEAETVTLEDHEGEIYLAIEIHPRAEEAAHVLVRKPAFEALCSTIKNVQVNFRHKPVFIVRSGQRSTDQEPPIGHFSQNNALANSIMLEEICRVVSTEKVTDLYAGAGNISLPLALKGHQVNAVEVDSHLVDFGRKKAALKGVTERLQFVQQTCEGWIEHGTPDPTVVLDPPRGGALEVAKRLNPSVSPHLIYISCYPPTFVRDAVELTSRGYRCESVKILDMFPQTYHAEIVAEFMAQ